MNTEQLKKYLLLHLPYLPVFWFVDRLEQAWRLVPNTNGINQLIGSISLLDAVMSRPLPSFHSMTFWQGLLVLPSFTGSCILRRKARKSGAKT